MSFTQDQLRNIGILQKTAGAISTICSTYLVVSVLSDEKKRSRVYHRLIAGISIFDAINSFNLFLSTWPIPKGEMLWAVGNDTTCNIQGFVAQLVLGNALYNASLAVYYLLVINYGWKETQIIKVEPYLHALPVVSTLATATYAWIKDMYRNSFFWCWISADLKIYRFTLFYIPNWICIGFITVVCILVFRHVRQVEARASQYRSGHSEIYSNDDLEEPEQAAQRKKKSNQKDEGWRTRMVATQCFLYATAFYFVWAGATVSEKRKVLSLVTNSLSCRPIASLEPPLARPTTVSFSTRPSSLPSKVFPTFWYTSCPNFNTFVNSTGNKAYLRGFA